MIRTSYVYLCPSTYGQIYSSSSFRCILFWEIRSVSILLMYTHKPLNAHSPILLHNLDAPVNFTQVRYKLNKKLIFYR